MKLSRQRLDELRKAALRRWSEGDNIARVAERLGVPARQIAEALHSTIDELRRAYVPGVTVDGIAADMSLPRPFVAYCFRWFSAAAREHRGKVRSSR